MIFGDEQQAKDEASCSFLHPQGRCADVLGVFFSHAMCKRPQWKSETAWEHTCSVRHQHKCHTPINTLLSIGCCVGCLSSALSRLFPLWVNVSYAWRWMENKAEWHFWTNESSDSQPELTFLLPCPHTLFKRACSRAIHPVSCPSLVINPVWP